MIIRSLIAVILVLPCVGTVQAASWSSDFSRPGFTGRVADVQVIGSEVVVCGVITANGRTATPGLAAWNGTAWEAVASPPPFTDPAHVAVIEGMIVTNGVNHSWQQDGPFRWTGTQWELMGSGLSFGYINRVECSATYDGQAVVGGFFFPPVAFWDGSDWVQNLPPNTDGVAVAMAVYDGALYVAGGILNYDMPGSDGLMRWDGAQWEAVTALDPATMTPVAGFSHTATFGYTSALAVHDGLLYIGGLFDRVGTMVVSNIVALDASTGQWVQVDGLAEMPNDLEPFGGDLYAGGPAGTIPGAVGPGSLGRLTGAGWIEAGASPDGTVDALEADAVLYVAGLFDAAGGAPMGNFTTWDGGAYADLANPAGEGFNGIVYDLEPYGATMLAAGDFSLAGGLPISGLAQWNDPGWSAFAGGGPDGAVAQLEVTGTDIHMVGGFTSVAGQPIAQIAHWDGVAWSGYAAALPSDPTCVATVGGDLYVGAINSYVDNQGLLRRGYLARWTGSDWDLIIADAEVYDATAYGGELWAAVANFEFDGSYPNVVAYDGAALRGPVPSAVSVRNLRVEGPLLHLLGDFGDMWTWDGVQLATSRPAQLELPDTGSGLGMGRIYDLYQAGDRIYLGTSGDYDGYTVWEWDLVADTAHPLDRGTDSWVRAICPFGDAWFFGGRFTVAGLTPALNFFNPRGHAIPAGGIARWDPGVSAAEPPAPADGFALDSAPNPFNPRTTIRFTLARPAAAKLRVYDVAGRLVRTLIDGDVVAAGPQERVWDGRSDDGRWAASGVYVSRLEAMGTSETTRMTLVR